MLSHLSLQDEIDFVANRPIAALLTLAAMILAVAIISKMRNRQQP